MTDSLSNGRSLTTSSYTILSLTSLFMIQVAGDIAKHMQPQITHYFTYDLLPNAYSGNSRY